MKIYAKYEDIPDQAAYLGSEYIDSTLDETVADAIDAAFEPACYRDAEDVGHYFDVL